MLSSLPPSVDSLPSLILLLGPRLYPTCLAQCAGLHLCCQIHVQFRTLLARFRFPFCRFVVVHSSQVHLVWLYDHHLRRVLVASNRPPFVLIRSYIWIQAALLRIAAPAKLSHVILRALPRFRYFPHAIPGLFGRIIHPPALTFDFLDPFAIKLTLLAVRCLQFPFFSCRLLARRRP